MSSCIKKTSMAAVLLSQCVFVSAFADVAAATADRKCAPPSSRVSAENSQCVTLAAGEYTAVFNCNADFCCDWGGIVQFKHRGAPDELGLPEMDGVKESSAKKVHGAGLLRIVPSIESYLEQNGHGKDAKSSWVEWKADDFVWKCKLSEDWLESVLTGPAAVALNIPVFVSDADKNSEITQIRKSLVVRLGGWVCAYVTDGNFEDTGRVLKKDNKTYRLYQATGDKKVTVKIHIRKETVCTCGEAPERRNDFYWENDKVGFRAYGPADINKWSGIDVFNKATAANIVCRFLREKGKFGNWHKNMTGLGMDNYAVGPGRGLGGIALRKDGKWLEDYTNWVTYRVLENSDERCAFELDYKLPIGGIMTLSISLSRGSSFFKESVSFSKDVPLDGVEVGVGIDLNEKRGHTGDVFADEQKGIISIFEKPYNRPHEEGSLMSALFIDSCVGKFSVADEPNGGKLLITPPLKKSDANGNAVITVYAGADWSEAGRNTTADEWHSHVKEMSQKSSK